MKIIGIDPGLSTTGFGVVAFENNSYSYIDSGIIQTSANTELSDRLLEIHLQIKKVLSIHNPQAAAIEQTYVNVAHGGHASSLKLAHARSAAILGLKLFGISVSEYQAKTVKKTLTGTGNADKKQMMQMINYFMPKSNVKSADAADALAIAICHGFYCK